MSGWVLDRLLGTGGFGEVWYARHTRMGSLSGAVKFCFGQSGQDLIHEAELINRIMAAGKHPNIVPLTHAHLEGECPWLMFEYVGGGTLTDWIHSLAGKSKEQRLKQVMVALGQLCEAVGHFHALPVPVVHRDLKPSNILLDRSTKRLRITDFGIGSVTARETNRHESRGGGTRGGRLLTYLRGSHTPLYSSPQQRNGASPDPRDDVHALGVIAYQMLTGHLAQGAGPDFADDLRDAGAGEELIALLGRCVAQKPERRPKDSTDLSDQFRTLKDAAQVLILQPDPLPATQLRLPQVERRKPDSAKPQSVSVSQSVMTSQLLSDVEEYSLLCTRGTDTKPFFQTHLPARYSAWFDAANSGNTAAMVLLGEALEQGIGVQQDQSEAVSWYRKAAESGNTHAMNNLATALLEGEGVPQNLQEGVRWLRKAAELGETNAMSGLGYHLDHGIGIEQNQTEAVRWLLRASELGNVGAMNNLAFAFAEGRGVGKDQVEAVRWFTVAADLGDSAAMYNLGQAYQSGWGVPRDTTRALAWFQKAAARGDERAMYELGRAMTHGLGISRNLTEAIRWYRKAAALGVEEARKELQRLQVSEE